MHTINSRIKQRHDVLSNWTQNNIVLLDGELAVVDCGNQIRFKIGNGVSAFNDLDFVDQHLLCTEVLDTHEIYSHAISQGTQAHSTPFGLAAGWRLSANANYSQALGFKSQTSVGHEYSFAWNGDDATYPILGNEYYTSHGKGTFNINPLSGTQGFYVGEKTLQQLLDEVNPICVPIQMIKPRCDENSHVEIGIFSDKEMSSSILGNAGPIDSSTSSNLFSYFLPTGDPSRWETCTSSGFPREVNNLPVIFDMPAALSTLGIDGHQYEHLYLKYIWRYTLSNETHYSDPYATSLPAATEVGANSQDAVNRDEFSDLYQNVIPQSEEVDLETVGAVDYYKAYSTKYSIIEDAVEDGAKIALMDYDEHKLYKIDLSTSSTDDVQLEFYVGLPNGNIEYSDDLNSEQHTFDKDSHYLLNVVDGKIFVYDADGVYASQGGGTNVSVDQLLDSGTHVASISVDGAETKIYAPNPRYQLLSATLSSIDGSLCCNIMDRSITTIEISSASTPIVVQLPPKQDDGARDFIVRIEISSDTAPSFTFEGIDENLVFDAEDEDWAVLEPGLNVISFTETR